MTKVVSFINYKGGVGKTTSAYHVGCSMAQHYDKRVLMIDIDPQTNLTFLCVSYEQWERRKRNTGTIKNLYHRYDSKKPLDVRQFIWHSPVTIGRYPITGLDLIPCDIDLLGEDLGGAQVIGSFLDFKVLKQHAEKALRDLSFLRRVIRDTEGQYDYVIIDCPPNLYMMTQNALHASDYYVITAIPDHLSTIGMDILTKKVSKIGKKISEELFPYAGRSGEHAIADLGAIVFVKVRIGGDHITNTHDNTMIAIAGEPYARGKVVQTHTTELIGYSEAAENRVPVWEHNSDNARRAARKNEYPEIARELIQKLY